MLRPVRMRFASIKSPAPTPTSQLRRFGDGETLTACRSARPWAGWLWSRQTGKRHRYGSALIGGGFITDGLNVLLHINDYRHILAVGIADIMVGFVLILLLEHAKERVASLLAALPVVALGLGEYQVLDYVTTGGAIGFYI